LPDPNGNAADIAEALRTALEQGETNAEELGRYPWLPDDVHQGMINASVDE
jgi:hypothetical protein